MDWSPEAENRFYELAPSYNPVWLADLRERAERLAVSRGQVVVLVGDVNQAHSLPWAGAPPEDLAQD